MKMLLYLLAVAGAVFRVPTRGQPARSTRMAGATTAQGLESAPLGRASHRNPPQPRRSLITTTAR